MSVSFGTPWYCRLQECLSASQPWVSSRDGGTQNASIRGWMLLCSALSAPFPVSPAKHLQRSGWLARCILWIWGKTPSYLQKGLNSQVPYSVWTSQKHPEVKADQQKPTSGQRDRRKDKGRQGGELQRALERTHGELLTFPLGPPPPSPLGLAFELTA